MVRLESFTRTRDAPKPGIRLRNGGKDASTVLLGTQLVASTKRVDRACVDVRNDVACISHIYIHWRHPTVLHVQTILVGTWP
jgi:hypothetical protein